MPSSGGALGCWHWVFIEAELILMRGTWSRNRRNSLADTCVNCALLSYQMSTKFSSANDVEVGGGVGLRVFEDGVPKKRKKLSTALAPPALMSTQEM